MEIEVRGAPCHTRTLEVVVSQAGAGEIGVRGHLLDLRKRGLIPLGGDLQTAGVIHDMRVHAQIDTSGPTLTAIRAEQPSVAIEPSSVTRGECCRDPIARIEALAGTPLDQVYPRRLSDAIGGALGCSHLLTLAQLVGSTAATSLARNRARFGEDPGHEKGRRIYDRTLSLDAIVEEDAVHAAIQLADTHFAPHFDARDPLEGLAAHHEIRAQLEVAQPGMTLASVRAARRESGPEGPGRWESHDEKLAELAGRPAFAGMAGALFARLGDDPADRPLLDALLNFAPLMIQTMATLVDRWARSEGSGTGWPSSGGAGMDSCYMMRSDGPTLRNLRTARHPGG